MLGFGAEDDGVALDGGVRACGVFHVFEIFFLELVGVRFLGGG